MEQLVPVLVGKRALVLALGAVLAVPALPSSAHEAPDAPRGPTVVTRTDRALPKTLDEVLVRFSDGTPGRRRSAIRAAAASTRRRALRVPGWEVVVPSAGQSAGELRRDLEAMDGVEHAELVGVAAPLGLPDDTYFDVQWGLHNTGQSYTVGGDVLRGTNGADVDAPAAWDSTTGSSDVVVAVIDTGVQRSHPDLSPNMWTNAGESGLDGLGADKRTNGIDDDANGYVDDWRGWDWVGDNANLSALPDPDNDPADADGHGTHVAGILGARGGNGTGVAGIAWGATIMPLRVLGENGGRMDEIADAVAYAVDMGADVINMSLGGSSAGPLGDVVAAATGTLVVAAAGNDGTDNDDVPLYPCNLSSSNVVCVAATDDDDRLASFSNYGAASVDLAAPGVWIASTYPSGQYAYLSGTSMATPFVSGAAALLRSTDPTATVAEMRAALLSSGDAKSGLESKTVTGRRLDVAGAIAALLDPPVFADVPPSHKEYRYIQAMYHAGITTGCASDPLRYCPDRPVDRAQMAVFLLRAMGQADTFGAYAGTFADAPDGWKYTPYIERFYGLGKTTGCASGPLRYCPDRDVDRAQMAVFVLRSIDHDVHLPSFQSLFDDAPLGWKYTPYIEHLYEHGITTGCGSDRYCPDRVVDRGQMAVFIARAFGLVS